MVAEEPCMDSNNHPTGNRGGYYPLEVNKESVCSWDSSTQMVVDPRYRSIFEEEITVSLNAFDIMEENYVADKLQYLPSYDLFEYNMEGAYG